MIKSTVISAAACMELVLGVLGSGGVARGSAFTFENGVYTLYPGLPLFAGINDAGQIVGYNADSSGGFLFANGVFTPITGPGRVPIGINNAGQILEVSNNSDLGALVTNGVASPLPDDPAAAASSTFYKGFNDADAFVGLFCPPPSCNFTGDNHSFLYATGVFTNLSFSGRTEGINDAGQIVGSYIDSNGRHGFLDSNGVFTTIDVPGRLDTLVTAISNTGYLAGDNPRELQNPGSDIGFLYSNGVFTTLSVPNASFTSVTGVNSAGEVVGVYIEAVSVPEASSRAQVAYGLTGLAALGILSGIGTRIRGLLNRT